MNAALQLWVPSATELVRHADHSVNETVVTGYTNEINERRCFCGLQSKECQFSCSSFFFSFISNLGNAAKDCRSYIDWTQDRSY